MASFALPLLSALPGVINGIGSFFGGNNAAKAYQDAANKANGGLDSTLSTINAQNSPYTGAGSNAVGMLNSNLQNGTGFAKPFSMGDFYNSPGYQFTLQQGQQGINNSAAARGGLLSGATTKALAGFNSGLANNTFQDAYNNYLNSRGQQYNELTGVAQLGQNSQNQVNNATLGIGGQQADNTFRAGIGAAGANGQSLSNLIGGVGGGIVSGLSQYYKGKGK